eukprot:11611522-Alexandrium_andersonii.AAC.1
MPPQFRTRSSSAACSPGTLVGTTGKEDWGWGSSRTLLRATCIPPSNAPRHRHHNAPRITHCSKKPDNPAGLGWYA